MQKKILLIDQADFIGGAELFNLDLINHLDLDCFNVNLVFSGNPEYQSKIKQHIKEYSYPLPKLKNKFFKYFSLLKSAWLIRTIVKKEKIELIQSNTIRTHIISAIAKKLFRLNVKLVWFVHDFTFPQNVLRKIIGIPDLILTCSETVKKDLIQKTHQKNSSKIKIVYNGVILKKIGKTDYVSQNLHNFLKNGTTREIGKLFRIGIIGRLDSWKGQDIFLQSAQKVLAKNKNKKLEFVIIGSASEYDKQTLEFEKKLHKLVKELNLEKNVKFLGHLEDLDSELQKLDLIVHASKQSEPFGRVIIEAMNWGKIVIASDLGGPREIIENAKDGYLISANNAEILAEKILEVLKDTETISQIGKNACEKVKEKFELKKQVKKIEKIWKSLIDEK